MASMVIPHLWWICLLYLCLGYFVQADSSSAERRKVTNVEPRSARVKRQQSPQESSNQWSSQDLIRDSGVSIWGPSNSGSPSNSGPGSSPGSSSGYGPGSSSGYGPGSGYGFGSDYADPWYYGSSHEEADEVGYESHKDDCPFPFTEVGSSCYYSICGSSPLSWEAAQQFCQNYSSQLAIFVDANQYIDALNYIKYNDPTGRCSYWIGGLSVNGIFQWTTGATMPVGTPFWGSSSPVNPTVRNYAILNKNDFYRIDNIANSQSGAYVSYPLCQYVPGTNSSKGNSYGSGGGWGGSGGSGSNTINTVINQAGGSSYRSVQNVTQINTPTLNVTVQDDFNTSSPINITVYPPQITYTYLEPEQYGSPSSYGLPSNYELSNNYGLPAYISSIHNYSPNPTSQQSGPWLVRTHGKTEEPTPQKPPIQGKTETSYPDLYVRILNTMKLLMARIEDNSKSS